MRTDCTTPQEIAADIAKDLRKDPSRWGKYETYRNGDPNSPCCLVGQIAARSRIFEDGPALHIQTADMFREILDDNGLTGWNDKSERTVEDVIAVCDKVATHAN